MCYLAPPGLTSAHPTLRCQNLSSTNFSGGRHTEVLQLPPYPTLEQTLHLPPPLHLHLRVAVQGCGTPLVVWAGGQTLEVLVVTLGGRLQLQNPHA